jgi:transcriptional regulator with XRE-family HTH domain
MDLKIEDFGRRIVEHRRPSGVRAAAEAIGISPATLSRIENGQVPDLATFAKICVWLGDDPSKYLGTGRRSETSPNATVHLRKKNTSTVATATSLGAMIIAVQDAILAKDSI